MRSLKEKLKRESGFTLIEMLIVVAIIAILIAIAIPMVNKALERAREATDAANERAALGMAMVEVLGENKLAGTPIDDSATEFVAYYKVENSKGSLEATEPTSGDDNYNYGKGTKYGDIEEDHTNKCVKIIYTPSTGAAVEADFSFDWF